MAKIRLLILLPLLLSSSEMLEHQCLACHKAQKIPSELIYRRYLMRYSDPEIIKEQMFTYLKEPKKENSIMPKQFFLKFSMKEMLDLNSTALEEGIEAYVEFFDIKKRLLLSD